MSLRTALIVLGWMLIGAVVFAVILYFTLRWVTLRIARRLAHATENAMASTLEQGMSRAGVRLKGVAERERRARYAAQIQSLARVMDRLVPLPFGAGIGLDAILGLIPVAGDALGVAISSLIVIRAAQLGVHERLLSRLIAIQCTDLVLGAVPIVGDIFDIAYQGNMKSAALIREWLESHKT